MDQRWQNAGDLADELQWMGQGRDASNSPPLTPDARRSSRRSIVAGGLAGGLLLAVLGAAVYVGTATSSSRPPAVRRLAVPLAGTGIWNPVEVALSPDGHSLALRASGERGAGLDVRRLNESHPRFLEGTARAVSASFSPDGARLAFWEGGLGLRTVLAAGGPVVPTLDVPDQDDGGLGWGEDGNIVFPRKLEAQGLWSVPARGGTPVRVMSPVEQKIQKRFFWPQVLPGGKAVIFTTIDRGHFSIDAAFTPGGPVKTLVANGIHARYLPATGHLVYQWKGHIYAARFDPVNLSLLSEPSPVMDDSVGDCDPFVSEYDVSSTGTLVYLPASVSKLSWFDRRGTQTPLPAELPGPVRSLALSPISDQAVLGVSNWGVRQLYRAQLRGEVVVERFTPGDDDWFGVFSRDGQRVFYMSGSVDGRYNIYSSRVEDGSSLRRETNSPNWHKPSSTRPSRDGEVLPVHRREQRRPRHLGNPAGEARDGACGPRHLER